MSAQISSRDSTLLFHTLSANGIFSLISGVVMVLGASRIAPLIGLGQPAWLLFTGVGLLGFGAWLLWLGSQSRIRRADAIAISLADLAWVVGTLALAFAIPGLFNTLGVAAIVAVGLIVLGFFELQAYALWKTRRSVRQCQLRGPATRPEPRRSRNGVCYYSRIPATGVCDVQNLFCAGAARHADRIRMPAGIRSKLCAQLRGGDAAAQ